MRGAWLISAAMLLAAPGAQTQTAFLEQSNVSRWAAGKYAYRSLARQVQNGEEDWLLTVHPDGTRTLRATNAYKDRAQVLRHVVMRVDASFRPLEAYLDYWVDGQWRSSGLATVTGNTLEVILNSPNGRIAQTLVVPEHFSMVPHPIATDSWPAWYYDRTRGGPQPITVYAFDGRSLGASGMLGKLDSQSITFAGSEKVSTPAGTFDCDKFVFGEGDPALYLFGRDRMIAKMTWKAADVEYVLSDYRDGAAAEEGGK